MKLEIANVKKKYGKKTILQNIDLSAQSGKCIGILGANGCGKSTLFSILAGVAKADSGSFLCDGENLLKNTKKRSLKP